MDAVRIETITAENVDKLGFFCQKSKRKTDGYQRKLSWMKQRLGEGMGMHILYEGKRSVGFIEYIPGDYTWRAIDAPNLMVIHCLWVVGKAKGKGYGSQLLALCEQETRRRGLDGIAVLTTHRVWLSDKHLFAKNDFELVDSCDPFELWLKRYSDGPNPTFPTDWDARSAAHGDGLTVLRTDQCPYFDDATTHIRDYAAERGLAYREIELDSAEKARQLSPTPYGAFGIVYNGKLLAYHYLLPRDLDKLISPSRCATTAMA